ncbi:MAG: hypothetical protein IJR50_03570 [Treponema sp.]|nr:hypothetical protein [Treponema sp.]
MKKFIACVIILLIASGAVFFFGWTQFKVGADSCGVLVSKTGGVNSEPVLPGKFSWHWECLLPTNATLKIFSTKPHVVSKTASGDLPSADVYGSMFDVAPNFSYRFDFMMTCRVASENIIELIRDGLVADDESLDAYIDSSCASLASKAASHILTKSFEDSSFRSESLTTSELLSLVNAAKDFPHIDFTHFAVTASRIPDSMLYTRARELFLEVHKFEVKESERNKRMSELLNELQQLSSGTES